MKRIKISWRIMFPFFIVAALVLSFIIKRPPLLPAEFFNEPTPTPAAIVPVPTPTPPKYDGAVDIVSGSVVLVTVESATIAKSLLEELFENVSAPEGETLLKAEFKNDISISPADTQVKTTSGDDARVILKESCPIRIYTRKVGVDLLPFDTQTKEDKRLNKSTRMLLKSGQTGESLNVSEYVYVDGELEDESLVIHTRPPVDESVIVGTYTQSKSEPSKDEGEKGPELPDGIKLTHPCDAKLTRGFGLYGESFSNGLEYDLDLGEKIKAPADGVIVFARERGSYGFIVEIDHGGGFVSRISPVAEFSLKTGDKVAQKDQIGVLAPPYDEDDEPSLHYELIIDGFPYNPRQYIG